MAFQIKNFISVVASMINHVRGTTALLTDFNVGSVVRTILEAPAIEIDQLYQQLVIGLQSAIPTSVFSSFNFNLLPANEASGSMIANFTASGSNLTIPAGLLINRPDNAIQYAVQSAVTLTAGSTTVTIPIVAQVAGSIGNLAQGTTLNFAQPPAGFISANNPAALTNGSDLETQTARKARFIQYVSTLSRGTIAAILYGLLNATYLTDVNGNITEQVKFAQIVEPYLADSTQPIGLVNCYIHNGVGGTSAALINQASAVIAGYTDSNGNPVPGYKAAGIHLTMVAATEVAVPVTGTITAMPGYVVATLDALAAAAADSYLLGLGIGQTAYRDALIGVVQNIPGVLNFAMSAPAADTTAAIGQKIMPGAIAIS